MKIVHGVTAVGRGEVSGQFGRDRVSTRCVERVSAGAWAVVWGPGIAVVALLLVWFVSSRLVNSILFPGPIDTVAKAAQLIANGTLASDMLASMRRIAIGFTLGSAIGVAIGLAVGWVGTARTILLGPLQFFRFIPAIAWISPVIVWFGIGELSKVVLIIYTTLFIVALNTLAGCAGISQNKLRAAQCLGATSWQIFRYVVVPGSASHILVGMRIAMGNSFMTIVAAEMLAADAGLGFLIFNSRLWLAIDSIFVAILSLGMLGLLADRLFGIAITKWAVKYFPERGRGT